MSISVPTELYLVGEAATPASIEQACWYATTPSGHETVAVAVDIPHTKQVADLLFGTGVGALSVLDPDRPLRDQARRSVAAGAAEVAVPLVGPETIDDLKTYLGSHTPLTIDVTAPHGLDLSLAERALRVGADFVALRPDFSTEQGLRDSAQLLNLASGLQLGGVKLAAAHATDRQIHDVINVNEWARSGRGRVCIAADELID